MNSLFTTRTITLVLALALAGAAVVLGGIYFFAPGKYGLILYALFAVGIAVVLRGEAMPYWNRFAVANAAFGLVFLAQYVWVASRVSIPFPGHLWRLGFVLAVSTAVGLVVSRLAGPFPEIASK